MRRHHRIDTVFNRPAKWCQFYLFDPFFRLIQTCQLHVAVFRRVAMTWEVFRRKQNVVGRIGVRSFNKRPYFVADRLWIFAERPDVDYRIIGVVVDIGVGAQTPTLRLALALLVLSPGRVPALPQDRRTAPNAIM